MILRGNVDIPDESWPPGNITRRGRVAEHEFLITGRDELPTEDDRHV